MKTALMLVVSYFVFAPLFLFSLIFYQLHLSHQARPAVQAKIITQKASVAQIIKKPAIEEVVEPVVNFIEAEDNIPTSQGAPVYESIDDPRVTVLKKFFGRYNSPLEDYAQAIVDTADNYGLDWRLLPAIAMQESTLCRSTPKNSFNCWGFGIYGGKVTRFSDYGEAINVITKAMARDYHALGLKDPGEIVKKYTPANTNDWSGNVSYFMDRIAPASL